MKKVFVNINAKFNTDGQITPVSFEWEDGRLFEIDRILDKIRKTLLQTSQEVAALSYCPHITLGLYREAVGSDHVLERMAEIEDIRYSLNVSKLTFGFYQSHVLQGALFSQTQIELGNAQCN